MRARHQQRPGDDQAGRGRDRRPRMGRGMGRAAAARGAHRQERRRRRFRARWARGRATAQPRRAPRRGVRARRSHRRAPALRHPRVQDGEALPRAPTRADATPRAPSSVPVSRSASTSRSTSSTRSSTRSCSRRARPRGATSPSLGASSVASIRRWSSCRSRTECRRATSTSRRSPPSGKHVVIIGGGDTGADCLGTVHRQGAAAVHQFEILPRPPDTRAPNNPWPQWSMVYRTSSAHEEGGERVFSVNTECFLGDEAGNVRALLAHEVEMRDGTLREGRRHRLRAAVRAGAARDGLRRPRARADARPARRRARRPRQRRP